MGSAAPAESSLASSTSLSVGPEALARLVLRCRELAAFLDTTLPKLPARDETPFLYGQLDDVLQRLQTGLRQIAVDEQQHGERGGFLRRLAGRRREAPRRSEPLYDLQGNAWTIPVMELVGFLGQSGKSGLLWVTASAETFVLEFEKGDLVHATSNAPPAAFRLGEILLTQKLIAPDELAQMIDLAKAADDLLGSYLLRTGRLRPADLQRVLAIQVQELFHRLMDAENALFRFQDGAQLLRSHSLEVNITHLLLESARKKDEERQKSECAKRAAEAPPAEPTPSVLDDLVAANKAAPEAPAAKAPTAKAPAAKAVLPVAPLPSTPAPEAAAAITSKTAAASAATNATPAAPAATEPEKT